MKSSVSFYRLSPLAPTADKIMEGILEFFRRQIEVGSQPVGEYLGACDSLAWCARRHVESE
jgi:hypothetical protein